MSRIFCRYFLKLRIFCQTFNKSFPFTIVASLQENYKKSIRIIFITLFIYGVLVATHLGEFWPFSIYPMFSQAGKPWNRAIVRDVTEVERGEIWKITYHNNLIGDPVPLKRLRINTNDLANFLSKTDVWTEGKIRGVRKLFDGKMASRELLLLQANGSLTRQDSIRVQFIPFIYLSEDTTILSSKLKTQ